MVGSRKIDKRILGSGAALLAMVSVVTGLRERAAGASTLDWAINLGLAFLLAGLAIHNFRKGA